MASKKMYRCLDLNSGAIRVTDWVYDGYVSLNEIVIDYDDQLKPEHAEMVAKAIDERVKKMQADIVVMEQKKKDLLAITHVNDNYGWEDA